MVGSIFLFVQTGRLHVKVWYGTVENVAVDILLGTPYIYRSIREILSGDRKVVPCHPDRVPILTKPATIGRRFLSSAKPSKSGIPHYNVVVRKAR